MVALGATSIVTAAGGFSRADRLAELTSNSIARPAPIWGSFLEYFNSIFALFFNTNVSLTDRSVTFLPPAGLAWVIPIIFQQTFTAYVFAALLPYLTLNTKLWGFAIFITICYWVGSWAWFTLTGLQLAEFSLIYLPLLRRRSASLYVLPLLSLALGLALKWAWASNPSRRNVEYRFHENKSDGTLNTALNPYTTPYPRVDDYFAVLGAMTLLELTPLARRILDNPVLRYLGRISFMLFLTSGTVCLGLGSRLYVLLNDSNGWTSQSQILAACFFACVPLSIAVAEVGYWLADWPSRWIARRLFIFLKAP